MKEPEYGLCLPGEIVGQHDADTVKVKVSWVVTVRIEDLRMEELNSKDEKTRQIAVEADKYLRGFIPIGTKVKLWVKPSLGKLASIFTFGRVVGRIFKDGIDITDYMNRWREEYGKEEGKSEEGHQKEAGS